MSEASLLFCFARIWERTWMRRAESATGGVKGDLGSHDV